jgi:hypothetical protein
MRWRVQLGINSTSDVWKFCQYMLYDPQNAENCTSDTDKD